MQPTCLLLPSYYKDFLSEFLARLIAQSTGSIKCNYNLSSGQSWLQKGGVNVYVQSMSRFRSFAEPPWCQLFRLLPLFSSFSFFFLG